MSAFFVFWQKGHQLFEKTTTSDAATVSWMLKDMVVWDRRQNGALRALPALSAVATVPRNATRVMSIATVL